MIMLVPLGFFIRSVKGKNKIDHKYIFLIYLIFSSLRGNGNGDYFRYINAVKYIKTFKDVLSPSDYPFEIGVRFINYLNNLLHLTPQFSIIIMSLISLSTIYYIIDRYSENEYISWLMYYPFLIYFDMHHSRSAIAINFTLLFYIKLFVDHKFFASIPFAVVPVLFHKSSIIPISLIFLMFLIEKIYKGDVYNDLEKNYYKILGTFAILTYFLSLKNLSNFLYKNYSSSYLIIKFNSYINNEQWSYDFKLYDPRLLILLLMLIISFKIISHKTPVTKYLNMYLFMGVLVILFFSDNTIFVMRFYNYFNLATIIVVPHIIHGIKINTPKFKCYNVVIIVVFLVYFSYLTMKQVPYYFFHF